MAAKSSVIPILRQISLKYASRNIVPARLFTACAGQLHSVNGGNGVALANVLPRMFGTPKFQSKNASGDARSISRSHKSVKDEEEKEEEDFDDEEFSEEGSDVDEISGDDLDDLEASKYADSDSD